MKGKVTAIKRQKVRKRDSPGAGTFFESPDDPYYLPSDAEAEQDIWKKVPKQNPVKPDSSLAAVGKEKGRLKCQARKPSNLKPKPRPVPDVQSLVAPATLEDRQTGAAKKDSHCSNAVLTDSAPGSREPSDVKELQQKNPKASQERGDGGQGHSHLPEVNGRAVKDRKSPKHVSRGFFRTTLHQRPSEDAEQVLSTKSEQAITSAPRIYSNPQTEEPQVASCSPAMSEALDGIANEIGSERQPQPQPSKPGSEAIPCGEKSDKQSQGKPAVLHTAKNSKAKARGGQHQKEPEGKQLTRKAANAGKSLSRLAKESKPELAPKADLHAVQAEPIATTSLAPGSLDKPQQSTGTPVLLNRALSSGLTRALAGRNISTPAPAVTVMEAQESGEVRQIQDSMLYALDGLYASASRSTQRESATTLLDICATRRGRLAFMSDGIFAEAMSSARRLLSTSWDADVALLFAAVMLSCCRDANGQAALASKQAITFLCFLLQRGMDETDQAGSSGRGSKAAEEKVARIATDTGLGKTVDASAFKLPTGLAALVIISSTEPQHTTASTDKLKTCLKEHGAIAELALGVARLSTQAGSDRWTWLFHLFLVALENCTFACPTNESYLVKFCVPSASSSVAFSKHLVHLIRDMHADREAGAAKRRDCLHCGLSVIMNMTHQNEACCAQVVEAGILKIGVKILADLVDVGKQSREAFLEEVDCISTTLGLLINIIEGDKRWVQELLGTQTAEDAGLLPLLCTLVEETWLPTDLSGPSQMEVTADDVFAHEDEGRAAVIQIYASLLAGFVMSASHQAKQAMMAHMSSKTIQPVVEGVQKCLEFYASTGAITARTEKSLREVLADLTPQ